MLKLFKNSFQTTNDCIILAIPLVLFMSVLGWYVQYAVNNANTLPKIILGIITFLIMASGFLSAWVYMAKNTIRLSRKVFVFDKDRAKALLSLVLSLPRGIGRLFLPLSCVVIAYSIIYILLFAGTVYVVTKITGSFNIDIANWHIDQLISSKELIEEINELTPDELITINLWYTLTSLGNFAATFMTMLWIPEIVYGKKNAFKALFSSIKKVFSNFKKSILLYFYIGFLILVISILNTLLMFNPFLYFIVLILYYYFLVYVVVLLFSYYEQNYIR